MHSKKIILSKNDSVERAVIKLLKCRDEEVVLSIPNFSQLANSLDNFKMIKTESDEAGKRVVIESVDDMVIELARRADLESINPFFAKTKRAAKSLEPPSASGQRIEGASPEAIAEELRRPETSSGGRRWGRNLAWLTVVALTAGVPAYYAATTVLPEAQVVLTTKKMNWDYQASLLVDRSVTAIDLENAKIPGSTVTVKKNGSFTFPASGKKRVSRKAKGTATIYNVYSAAPQSLVASTRLETPDGKVFRIVENITIPGAIVTGDKIVPSSITTAVVADRGGEEYNSGPVPKFTIPGFRHLPKFAGFYAASTEPMTGGFTGEAPYPTDEDIQRAKSKAAAVIEGALRLQLKNELPSGHQTLEGATAVTIIKQTTTTEVNQQQEFTVFTEAELKALAFQEADVTAVINQYIQRELSSDLRLKQSSLTYGAVQPDLAKGTLVLPITFRGQLEYPIDRDRVRQQLIGRSPSELRAALFALPGLANVKISLWPFWVKRVPKKVDITIE